jgi:zinc protease
LPIAAVTGGNVPKKYAKLSTVKSLTNGRGVKFLFMEDNSAPLVHVRLAFKYSGSAYQEKSRAGLPEFFSRAVFCGCGEYSPVQLERKVNDLAAIVDCSSNCDAITFSLTVPKLVLKDGIALLNAIITKPKFEKDRVKLIKDNLVARLQNYVLNPSAMVSSVFIPSVIFESHPYGNGKFGTAEDLSKLSIDDLKKYQSDFIGTSNAEACVFGNVSESEAVNLLDETLKGVPVGTLTKDIVLDTEPVVRQILKEFYEETPQSTVMFVLRSARHNSARRYSAAVLCLTLGGAGIFGSRIMSLLRTKEGLIYGGSTHVLHLNHASYLLGSLKTKNSNVKKTIEFLKKIIEDIRINGITAEDLEFAKNHLSGSAVVALRTSGDMCDFFFREMQKGGGETALEDLLNGINAVQLEDVNALAKETLDENNILFVTVGGNE